MKQQEQLDMLVKTLGIQGGFNRGMQMPRQASQYNWSPEGQPICFRCKQVGHIVRHCMRKGQDSQAAEVLDIRQGKNDTEQPKN